MLIYFIPWFSWLKMKVIKKKIEREEEEVACEQNHHNNDKI
jgi:hypothetical protein